MTGCGRCGPSDQRPWGNFGAELLNVEPLHRQGVGYLLQEQDSRLSLLAENKLQYNIFRTGRYFEKSRPISVVKREKKEHSFSKIFESLNVIRDIYF